MPLGDSILGRGSLAVDLSATPPARKYLRYEIKRTGIQFFELGKPANQAAVDGFSVGAIAKVEGHLLLTALPAAPHPTFSTVGLTVSATEVTLTVKASELFAATADVAYKQLNLTFTQQKGATQLVVSGGLTAVLYGQDVPLQAKLTPDQGLVFAYVPGASVTAIAIPPLGTLNLSQFQVSAATDPWAGLQALYLFDKATYAETSATITLYDSSGTRDPLDLRIAPDATGKAPQLNWSDGLAIDNKTPPIRSITLAKKIIDACKESDAITLEAWIKPATTGTNPPGRIITLSADPDRRNVTLQQGFLDGKPSVYAGFVRIGPSNPNGEPAIQSQIAAISGMEHVVFTRDRDGTAQLYVNGIVTSSASRAGNFDAWADYCLTLGNEFQPEGTNTPGIRPWAGQLHRIAIYDRALTAAEVRQRTVPVADIQGALLFDNVPVPLNAGIQTRIEQIGKTAVQPEFSRISTDPTATLGTADFQLKKIRWSWDKTTTALELSRNLPDNGSVTLSLWNNDVDFVATAIPGSALIPSLQLRSPNIFLSLVGLGNLQGRKFNLSVNRTTTPPVWIVDTDVQLTLDVIPPPLRGPFPPILSITTAGQPQLQVNGTVAIADNLAIPQFRLLLARNAALWDVQGNVEVRLFARSFNLVPKFLTQADQTQIFSLSVTPQTVVPGGNPSLPANGNARTTLVILDFYLLADVGALPQRWKLAASGDIANFTQFQAQGTLAVVPPQNSVQLLGTSTLQILGNPIFQGDLQLRRTSVMLHGNLQFAPEWSPLQLSQNDVDVEILADGTVQFLGPANQRAVPIAFSLPNFQLFQPRLAMFLGRPQLTGVWLGEAIALQSFQKDKRLVWQGTIPFSLDLNLLAFPAMYDPRSVVNLATLIPLSTAPDSQQQMQTNLSVELSTAGFLALLRSQLVWQDETPILKEVEIPAMTLFQPPDNRNDLVRLSFDTLRDNAATLLEPYLRHTSDYFVTQKGNQSLIYQGDRTQIPSPISLTLPPIFNGPTATIFGKSSANVEIFRLEQSTATTATLTIQLPTPLPTDVKAAFATIDQAYRDLIGNLRARESATTVSDRPLLWGITVVQQRLAENLPLPLEQVLSYYYGFNSDPSYVDLYPGMRLRVDYQVYQSILPTDRSPDRPTLSGFVGNTTAYYQLNRYSRILNSGAIEYLLGFDPFVSKLVSGNDTNLAQNISNSGAGGLIDLLQAGFRRPYYRLFYARQVAGGTTTGRSERVATLVGSDNLTDIEAATEEFRKNGQITIPPGNNSRVTFFFRGRALVIPEIQIFIHEQPTYVPIGTTLRQLLEAYTDILPTTAAFDTASTTPTRSQPPGVARPQRLSHAGVNNTPSYRFINLDAYPRASNGTDAFDLPVVKGDRFYF